MVTTGKMSRNQSMINRLFDENTELLKHPRGHAYITLANQVTGDLLDKFLADDPNVSLRDAQLLIQNSLELQVIRRIVERTRK